jgi:signal transduction histidine kinase
VKRQWLFLSVLLSVASYSAEVKNKVPANKVSTQGDVSAQKEPILLGNPITFTGKNAFDPAKKRQDVLDLMAKGEEFLKKNSFISFVQRINLTTDLNFGELYLFVYDQKGRCYAHGRDRDMTWKNLIDYRDVFGTFFVKKAIEIAQKGGGWIAYDWHDATKVVYAKMIEKDGDKYILGCGFYPHSKEDAVVTLVRGAASTFYSYIDRGASIEDAFSDFSFLGGKFVYGDLYVYVIDKDLIIRANGRDPGEIGLSYWDIKDEQGNYLLRSVPAAFENSPPGRGHWFDYVFYNAPMRTYVERVIDKKGKAYFIACGYHQYADREMAVDLVERGDKAVKERGVKRVSEIINDWANREFVYGRMALFIYDFEGNVIAEGARPTLVGRNMLKDLDESGYAYVQELLDRAKKEGKVWLSFRLKKATCSIYAQVVEVEGKRYIVGTSFFSIAKESAMMLLVKSAQGLLDSIEETKAFRLFSDYTGKYVSGDLTIFVYGLDGTCYADGLEVKNVWRNMLQDLDEEGRPYVKIMINEGKKRPAKVVFKKYGARMVAYVEPVKKGTKTYIIGSGYYV